MLAAGTACCASATVLVEYDRHTAPRAAVMDAHRDILAPFHEDCTAQTSAPSPLTRGTEAISSKMAAWSSFFGPVDESARQIVHVLLRHRCELAHNARDMPCLLGESGASQRAAGPS